MCATIPIPFDNLKLKNVFSTMSSEKIHISDDSILHMLQDIIKKNVTSVTAINSCGLPNFVSTVLNNVSRQDITIVTFCVQLVGWLGSDAERYDRLSRLLQESFSGVLTDGSLMGNMSVVTALYNSLTQTVIHSSGLLWILDHGKDLMETSHRLLGEGRSIFVKKAITAFLSSLVVQASRRADEEEIYTRHVTEVIENLHTACQELFMDISPAGCGTTQPGSLVSQLHVLETACRSCDQLAHKLVTQQQLVDDVIKAVEILNGREQQLATDIVKLLLPKCHDGSVTRAVRVLNILLAKDELKSSQSFVTFCLSTIADFDRAMTERLLILPVKFILGEMDQSEAVFENHLTREVVQSNMKRKCQQTDLLCHSVECLGQCQMFEMAEVCRLFEMTCYGGRTNQKAPVSGHLSGNWRLQRACMQYLAQCPDAAHAQTDVIVSSILDIMKGADIDSLTYTACTKCLPTFLPNILQLEANQEPPISMAAELALTLQHHLSNLHWELRDTTLEFLGAIMKTIKDHVVSWIQCHRLHVHIWRCVTDGHSYVRATAINTLAVLLAVPQLWASLLEDLVITEDAVIDQILGILETDTEAFPRRSAATFMHGYYQQKVEVRSEVIQSVEGRIMETMVKAVDDFDWEVKHAALVFLETAIDHGLSSVEVQQPMPDYVTCIYGQMSTTKGNADDERQRCLKAVNKLRQSGVFTALFNSVNDYDQKVSEKACNVLAKLADILKTKLWKTSIKAGPSVDDPALKDVCQNISSRIMKHTGNTLSSCNVEHQAKKLKVDTDETVLAVQNAECNISDKHIHPAELMNGTPSTNNEVDDLYLTVQQLISFNISEYSHKFCSTSDYEANPSSLLDDILSYGSRHEDDNIVDCY